MADRCAVLEVDTKVYASLWLYMISWLLYRKPVYPKRNAVFFCLPNCSGAVFAFAVRVVSSGRTNSRLAGDMRMRPVTGERARVPGPNPNASYKLRYTPSAQNTDRRGASFAITGAHLHKTWTAYRRCVQGDPPVWDPDFVSGGIVEEDVVPCVCVCVFLAMAVAVFVVSFDFVLVMVIFG